MTLTQDDSFSAASNHITGWEKVPSSGRFAFQIVWKDCHNVSNDVEGLDGNIDIEMSMDANYPSTFFSITLDIGDNSTDALIYDFETAIKFWRISYTANSITGGTIYIVN